MEQSLTESTQIQRFTSFTFLPAGLKPWRARGRYNWVPNSWISHPGRVNASIPTDSFRHGET
eukprot:5641775-Lingulodinium_polyedra.AAC.1